MENKKFKQNKIYNSTKKIIKKMGQQTKTITTKSNILELLPNNSIACLKQHNIYFSPQEKKHTHTMTKMTIEIRIKKCMQICSQTYIN